MHEEGYAHSVECYLDKELVGGLYGVSVGGVFFGESMFSNVSEASKFALVHLIERLILGGYVFLDTQFITDHLRQFGVKEVSRKRFQYILSKALSVNANFKFYSGEGFIGEEFYPLSKKLDYLYK